MDQDVRSGLLQDEPGDPVIVEHRGFKAEIRAPTLAQQRYFSRAAKDRKTGEVDAAKLLALSIIGCTYLPGTTKQVFEAADEEALMAKSTDTRTIVGKIAKAMQKLLNADPTEVEQNFDQGQSGD